MRKLLVGSGVLALVPLVGGLNFPFEAVQLNETDVGNFSAIAFGNSSDPASTPSPVPLPACREHPGSPHWPADAEWARLNSSLDGALLQPAPAAAVCYRDDPRYDESQCLWRLFNASRTRFYLDDPLNVLTQWPQGDTCPLSLFPRGRCTQGGSPVYVVNATSVRQIQIAVNFARNKNLRLVIKNTGHEFVGRSTGYGSLSIWTHHLKSFEYLPDYRQGRYQGRAARVAAGLEAWEASRLMRSHNISLVLPASGTVGVYGGFAAGGGHTPLSSSYGLGSDQVLSLQVVTADGRFVTADTEANQDLFFALRGGGPSTYGVVTSAVVKAYEPITVGITSVAFSASTANRTWGLPPFGFNGTLPPFNGSFPPFNMSLPPFNVTLPPLNVSIPPVNVTVPGFFNGTFPPLGFPGANSSSRFNVSQVGPVSIRDVDAFWKGVEAYHRFTRDIVDAGGTAYSYISSFGGGNASFSFSTNIELPGRSRQEVAALVRPLLDALNDQGIPVSRDPRVQISDDWGSGGSGVGDMPSSGPRFATRILPRANFEDATLFRRTSDAIRRAVQAGYTFHGITIAPTREAAGYPGADGSGLHPAWRDAIMDADVFDNGGGGGIGGGGFEAAHAAFARVMDGLRAVSPAGGSYVNECDVQEPDWQQAFFGSNYARLLAIKKARDPWGVFWAPATVGSEGWAVRTADGLPTQNGPLCRADATDATDAPGKRAVTVRRGTGRRQPW